LQSSAIKEQAKRIRFLINPDKQKILSVGMERHLIKPYSLCQVRFEPLYLSK